MADTPKEGELSRSERARQMRRAAYLRAKEQRATDPRYLAMKEAAKQHRRERYQVAKEHAKAANAAKRQVQEEKADAERVARRAAADEKFFNTRTPITWRIDLFGRPRPALRSRPVFSGDPGTGVH